MQGIVGWFEDDKYLHFLHLSDEIIWIMSVMGKTLSPDQVLSLQCELTVGRSGRCEVQPLKQHVCVCVCVSVAVHAAQSMKHLTVQETLEC